VEDVFVGLCQQVVTKSSLGEGALDDEALDDEGRLGFVALHSR
jgi:hypothetical protein